MWKAEVFEVGRGVGEAISGLEQISGILNAVWKGRRRSENREDVVRLFKDDQLCGCSFIQNVVDIGVKGWSSIRTTAGNLWNKKFYLWAQTEITLEGHLGIQGLSTQGLLALLQHLTACLTSEELV